MPTPRTTIPAILWALLAWPGAAVADIGGAPSRVHVLSGALVVTGPGTEPFRATVIVSGGRIEMVGADVDVPPGALVHDLTGRTIYPGWVEPVLVTDASRDRDGREASRPDSTAPANPNPRIHPEVRAVESLPVDGNRARALREAGFTVAQVVPGRGILRGTTAVVALADGPAGAHVLRPDHAQAFAFEHAKWDELAYPGSLMGTIALTRQTLLDARWNREARQQWARDPGAGERPPEDLSLRALLPVLDRAQPLLMFSPSVSHVPRALALAGEFRLDPVIVSERPDHYRRIDRVAAWLEQGRSQLVASLAFPDVPTWTDEDGRTDVDLDALLDWDRAPGDLAALEAAGVEFAVTSYGLEEPKDVLPRLRRAVRRGLSPRAAIAALTTRPAAILGISHRVGTIEPGKDADLVVATGDLFDPDTRIEAVWVDGERYGPDPRRAVADDVTHRWALHLADADTAAVVVEITSGRAAPGLAGRVVRSPDAWTDEEGDDDEADDTAAEDDDAARNDEDEEDAAAALTDVLLLRGRLDFGIPARAWGGGAMHVELELDGSFLRGTARFADGRSVPVLARPVRPARMPRDDSPVSADAPAFPPEAEPRDAPPAVIVRHATIWTCGPQGTLPDADLLVRGGRVAAVGTDLDAPGNAVVIDGTGLHVTPGLVDCHSHSSIAGDVNECTQSCTAEVRIEDVVDAESPAIYRELAGGLTVENLVHGSCNVIGGQNAVIKLRWGAPAEGLFLAGAPAGIKFALGENVTRSGWDEKEARDRYPNTRMGVEQFLRDRFDAAEDYRRAWDEYRSSRSGIPPRRDLELDALLDVLQGTRLVHCHAYRADEIVMVMRVAEDFGFRVATFQHALEAYKVANEIAAHGAGVSCFSDWWSYKVEVIDAIPYAGAILWRRGVNVSYNSDSSELSRRLNLEAAKAVKYGGVPEEEALRFVTLNPAVQLGIDARVGSLEPGKDGDFVIWSAHPLSDLAVCRQTWIEGVKRFDRDEDAAAREAAEELRERLLEKAEKVPASERGKSRKRRFPGWSEPELGRRICVEESAGSGGGTR